ncbi:MAG TPA: SUMF1/EgtB/PvdO family nonheme iron enzyme [Bryobacteraceae bacterium]|nr:SUMF1/EgtB/PvdO family nonheme iron enzyme [Bryobacteraceae bacterium]
MEHQVFISYSSQDKELADRVCAALENAGFPCWIAPRDIEEGADFPSAIVQAITTVKSMVVLLTTAAVASPHVLSEIGHAFDARKRMLPVRLIASDLPPDFDYFLSTQQWLDASQGFTDETLKRLIEAVSGSLAGDQEAEIAAQRRKKRIMVAAAVAVFLTAVVILGYQRLVPRRAAPDPPVAASVLPAAKVTSLEPSTGPSEIKTAVNPKDGQKYVWIPPGSFTMGCSAADNECKDDEKPAHRVRIPAGFWLAQTEVTNAAYRKAAPAKASKTKSDAAMPIQGLSWPEAKTYCSATGGRLPTEAEWEYAARAGTSEAYYDVPSNIAWYARNSGGLPHPVGMKEPNRFGLYDMLGNVSEWVLDRYYNQYDVEADAVGPHVDQPLAGNASAVSRGGFWDAELSSIRVSHRTELPNDEAVETAGVRCANDRLTP